MTRAEIARSMERNAEGAWMHFHTSCDTPFLKMYGYTKTEAVALVMEHYRTKH